MRRILGLSSSISLTVAVRNTASRSVLKSGKASMSVATENSKRLAVVEGRCRLGGGLSQVTADTTPTLKDVERVEKRQPRTRQDLEPP
jgi:hypothetical protein